MLITSLPALLPIPIAIRDPDVHCRSEKSVSPFRFNPFFLIRKTGPPHYDLSDRFETALSHENGKVILAVFSAFLNKAQVAALTAAAYAVKQAVQIPVGLDAAFNDCEADIAIAAMVGASFIRVPVFVDTVLFTDGIIQPCAKKCMEYRKMMGQENVKILADVQVKHAHMLREHITIEQSAKDAASNGADGIIVTGTQVGEETPLDLIKRVKNVVNLPVFAGSGVNAENIHDQLQTADGAIIGSSLKEGGILTNPISYELVKKVLDGLK